MMQLNNVEILGMAGIKNIVINKDKILSIQQADERFLSNHDGISLSFENAMAFPGLINSHDHLDFNLFPQIGNKIYANYTEWGADIHKQNKNEIKQILKIPKHLRTEWGIYKNLLNGITTVVNHGEKIIISNRLITVFQTCHSLHSTAFETNWKLKLNNPFKKFKTVVAHIGEGTGMFANKEINKFIKWNFLKKRLIAVHGVAMDEKQAPFFKALVWCPATNYFLLDKTATVSLLKKRTNILFGTDSTLTASWNLWEHLRIARKESGVSSQEIIDMLTNNASFAWDFKNIGTISNGKQADIVIAKKNNNLESLDAFFELNPKDLLLVMHQGQIKLFDETLLSQLVDNVIDYNSISIQNSIKYVYGNINKLMDEIRSYHPNVEFFN